MTRDTLLECFTSHYITTALWASREEADELSTWFDVDAGDLAPETLAQMQADCATFWNSNASTILCGGAPQATDFDSTASESERVAAMAGHDFWLTRNNHGAGFWDGDWPEAAGRKLEAAAYAMGSVDLYVGDDGLIYQC